MGNYILHLSVFLGMVDISIGRTLYYSSRYAVREVLFKASRNFQRFRLGVIPEGYYLFKHRLSVCKSAGLVKNDRIGKCVFFKIFSALYRNVIISGFFNSGYNGYRC